MIFSNIIIYLILAYGKIKFRACIQYKCKIISSTSMSIKNISYYIYNLYVLTLIIEYLMLYYYLFIFIRVHYTIKLYVHFFSFFTVIITMVHLHEILILYCYIVIVK